MTGLVHQIQILKTSFALFCHIFPDIFGVFEPLQSPLEFKKQYKGFLHKHELEHVYLATQILTCCSDKRDCTTICMDLKCALLPLQPVHLLKL